MPFTSVEIERDWLGGNLVALAPDELSLAFDTVETYLGNAWIQDQRGGPNGPQIGSLVVLPIAAMGRRLQSIQNADGLQRLVGRLRSNDRAAKSELATAHLAVQRLDDVKIEFEIPVKVNARLKVPDIRLTRGDDTIYVEVTAPETSDATRAVQGLIQHVITRTTTIPGPLSIEIVLMREPNNEETETIVEVAEKSSTQSEPTVVEIRDLAFVVSNRTPPGLVEPFDFGRDFGPMVGSASSHVENGVPTKSVAVRVPISDQRAFRVLSTEAAQLPPDHANLIVIDVTSVPGAFSEWEPLLLRRLQPQINTRISAVCLLRWGMHIRDHGLALVPEIRLLLNQHARKGLPLWLSNQMTQASGQAIA